MPSIADLYSTIDSYKRRAADVLSDPQNSLMQMLGYANDRARNYNESLAQASKERGYGPKTQELAQAMAEAYNPVGITTWHGSPHTFNKFDLSKIGTGEGSQAYGHGLYVAQNPNVAKEYQKIVQGPESTAQQYLKEYKTRKEAISALEYGITPNLTPEAKKFSEDAINILKSGKELKGNLYKVDLPDEHIEKMLDWDKPLSQQPKNVQEALKGIENKLPTIPDFDLKKWMDTDPLASTFHNVINRDLKVEQPEISSLLASRGIPGIKYLDEQSRNQAVQPYYQIIRKSDNAVYNQMQNLYNAKEFVKKAKEQGVDFEISNPIDKRTRNFVIFDPNIAKIEERNSIPIPQDPHAPNYLEDVHNALVQKLIQSKGLYETTQEGPFLRVRPRNNQGNASFVRGIREEERPIQGNTTGSSGYDIPSRISDEEIKAQIKSPNNLAKQVADNYSLRTQGKPYALPQMEESSLKKQSAIGRTFMHAATEDPEYKKAIFEAYKKQMPELIEQHNIQNYDDLVNKSYKQLAKETEDQFREMPVNMSYHKNGEGNYKSSVEMLKDVHGNNHLYVYQGGDPHDFLNAIDPETGLNTNEKFRAIHDYFGHAVHGNTFGPMGEETAWGAHSQMFSPLAKLAMTAETRGQNSVVNYSPLNAELKKNLNLVEKAMASTKNPEDLSLLQAQKDKLWGEFQFAPQKSVILPPEFSDVNYKGGMPEYIQPLIKPNPETAKSTFLTHFSNEPNLTFTDPSRYGSGIAGAESERLKNYSGAVKDRSYFYTGNPEQVKPEPGLGAYKYISEANNLYDISQDPLKLRTLAQEANRTPWRSNVNAGQTYNVESDLERLIKEHGYQGYMTGDVTAPSAALFYKTPVTRYDEVLSKINQDVHSPNYLEDLHKALAQKPIDVTDVHAPNYLEDIHNQLANQQ